MPAKAFRHITDQEREDEKAKLENERDREEREFLLGLMSSCKQDERNTEMFKKMNDRLKMLQEREQKNEEKEEHKEEKEEKQAHTDPEIDVRKNLSVMEECCTFEVVKDQRAFNDNILKRKLGKQQDRGLTLNDLNKTPVNMVSLVVEEDAVRRE
eukprot:gene16955-5229_t